MTSEKRYSRLMLGFFPLGITAVVQWALGPLIYPHVWFLFYPSLLISSWTMDRRSGLIATALSTGLIWWLFVPPEHSFVKDPQELFAAGVFFSTGTVIIVFNDRLRKTTERLLKVIEERRVFAALIDNSPDFIGITDRDGQSGYVTPSGRRMVGLAADHPAENTTIPDCYPAGATMIVQVVSTLKELEHLREEWASVVAHDLQQPISVIVLRSDLLLHEGLTETQTEDVREVRSAAKRLSRMVNDLMDASLLETSRMRITLDRLDLGQLVRAVVERDPDAAARTDVRTPIDSRLFVKGDEQRLEQVVTNLLSNALKYGAPETQIGLDVRDAGGYAEVLVTNRGPGIPGDELPFLFERYFRSRAARTSGTKGSGLGLYIAKGLVEAHGGRIWAESTPAETTTFHFTVPLDGPPMPTPVLSSSPDEGALQPEFEGIQP